tara:strand:- start:196 stop:675 length:480 start_codon:yes stop_codon:yes gene_type:complete
LKAWRLQPYTRNTKDMDLKKVSIDLSEADVAIMVKDLCKKAQSDETIEDVSKLLTELLLKSTEGCNQFVQIILGNGLPNAFYTGDVVRCNWDRLKMGLSGDEEIHQKLVENDLIDNANQVICKVKSFRGYTEYFPYTIEFKYGEDLYASCSMGFEDVHP